MTTSDPDPSFDPFAPQIESSQASGPSLDLPDPFGPSIPGVQVGVAGLGDGKGGKVVAKDGHTYTVSSTARATVAPTNAHTLANAEKTTGLTSAQAEFVTSYEYEFRTTSAEDRAAITYSPFDALIKEYNYTLPQIHEFLADPEVRKTLDKRGLTYPAPYVPTPEQKANPKALSTKRPKLSGIQLVVANTLLDLTDTRPIKKKLQDLGVSTYQYANWLKKPAFNEYLRKNADGMLGESQHEAVLALLDRVSSGDLRAIEYYHELTGRFQRASTKAAGGNAIDLQNIVVRIIEIINDEVHDPDVAARISDKLKGLAAGMQFANALSGPVQSEPNNIPGASTPVGLSNSPAIEQPEIAPPRPITPAVQALMDQGLGYDG